MFEVGETINKITFDNMKEMYIITGKIKGENDIKYLSLTKWDGYNRFYWSESIKDSILLDSHEDCKKLLELPEFTKDCIMCSGIKYPPSLLHNLSKTNFDKASEDVEIFISRLHLENISCQEYHCEIKKPTKVNYEYK